MKLLISIHPAKQNSLTLRRNIALPAKLLLNSMSGKVFAR